MTRSTENNRTIEARKSLEEIISEQLGTLSLEEQNIQDLLAKKREKAKEAQRRFREKNILVEGKKVKPSFEELLPSTIANLKTIGLEEALYLSDVPATIGYDEVDPLTFVTKMAEVFSSIYLSLPETLRPILSTGNLNQVNAGEEILYSNMLCILHTVERKCIGKQKEYADLLAYINKPSMKALVAKYSEEDKDLVLKKLDSSKEVYTRASTYLERCIQLRTLFAEFHKLCDADGYENLREFVALSLAKVQDTKDYKANLGL